MALGLRAGPMTARKTPPKRSRSGTATRPNADRGPKAARMVTVTLAPDVVALLDELAPTYGGKSPTVAAGIRRLAADEEIDRGEDE